MLLLNRNNVNILSSLHFMYFSLNRLNVTFDRSSTMVRRKTTSSRSSSADSPESDKSNRTSVIVHRSVKKRRTSRALQEIKYYRRITKLLIPKAPFARLVREIIAEIFPQSEIRRVQVATLEALQESAEMYLTQFFEDSFLIVLHSRRVTLMQRDMTLLRRLRGRGDIINK